MTTKDRLSARPATRRVFLADAKGTDVAVVDARVEKVRQLLVDVLGDAATVEVTPGYRDYALHWHKAGSWEAWGLDVAVGTVYSTNEPRYHVFIVPSIIVGRATHQIIAAALAAQKVVLHLDLNALTLARVRGIETYTADWRNQGRLLF